MIIEYSEDGKMIRSLYDLGAEHIVGVSEVLDLRSTLYLGSFNAPYVGRIYLDTPSQSWLNTPPFIHD